ncbi:MAG TPA: small membrane protein MtfM [Actinocatenispora sp.]
MVELGFVSLLVVLFGVLGGTFGYLAVRVGRTR